MPGEKMVEKEAEKGAAPKENGSAEPAGKAKAKKEVVEISEEDAALKENLELCVSRAGDPDAGVAKLALETLLKEIRTATRRALAFPRNIFWLKSKKFEMAPRAAAR